MPFTLTSRLLLQSEKRGLRLPTCGVEDLIRAVLAIPYGRARSRESHTILWEWRGTCSGKHYLLRDVLAEQRHSLGLFHRVYRITPADALNWYSSATAAFVPPEGLVDVHTYGKLTLNKRMTLIDVTFPVGIEATSPGRWDGRTDMPLACGAGEDFPVAPDQDPQSLKEELIRLHCDAETRESFIKSFIPPLLP
jgi:hypothetical protein